MAREIRFRPNGWKVTQDNRRYPPKLIEQQEIWEQLDEDTWRHITLERPRDGFHRAPYIRQARMVRGLQPNGSWRLGNDIYDSLIGASVVEDPDAPVSHEPIYRASKMPNAAAQHIERTEYAVPGKRNTE